VAAAAGNGGGAVLHVADLSLLRDAKAVAAKLLAANAPVHFLVNNAGGITHPRKETVEGFEPNFALMTLAPYALTNLLLPLLKAASPPARVICVASGGQYTEGLEVDDLQWTRGGFDGARQYARDKRREVALMELYATKHAPLFFASMHPGWADTDAVREALPQFYESLKPRLRSPAEGADTVVWLCTAPAAKLSAGGFYFDRRSVEKHLGGAFTTYPPERVEQLEAALAKLAGL